MKYDFDNKWPLWHRVDGVELKPDERVVNRRIVKCYPDADGGLWYWHPETGKEIHIDR